MSEYYYLAASLPYLKFGEELPITTEGFLYECEKWMEGEDMSAIASALEGELEKKEKAPSVLGQWKSFDLENKERMSEIRKAKKIKKTEGGTKDLEQIFRASNPLMAEEALERKRWDFLDSLHASFQFDINWLVLYALKLKINERLGAFDKDKGENIFYNFCEVIYEQSQG